jgi:Spy/CpxP family protein refolding chaperone
MTLDFRDSLEGGQAMHTGWWMSMAAALVVALAPPASAQMMGPMGQGGPMGHPESEMRGGMMGQMPGAGMQAGRGGRALSHEGPLISIMLDHTRELGLRAEQERKLRDLRTNFEKESVRRTAEIRVLEIELDSLLEQDTWDLAKIEPNVKQIASLQADLRLGRIRTLEAGRAVLTAEQLEKLKQVGHRMRTIGSPGMLGPGMGMPGPGMMGPGMPAPGGPPAPRQ